MVAAVRVGRIMLVAATTAVGAPLQNSSVAAADLADAKVFSPFFYLYNNPDVIHAGCYSPDCARSHWLSNGAAEGRQASGAFHARQYLDRYADLKAAFGSDFQVALNHYLTDGIREGRLGFATDGGPYGRWTIADQELGIFLSASARTAGAIDSLVWADQEFINARDHGRELQFAITNEHGECYNPTEAGSGDDSDGTGTSSVLQGANTNDNVLRTTVLPGFWLAPGEKESSPSPSCTVSVAPSKTSNYQTSKAVSFRPFGIPRAIQYDFTINLPESVNQIQVEAPTGYMTQSFTSYFTLDVNTGALTGLSHDPNRHEQPLPVIFASADSSLAMGAYAPSSSHPPASYAQFDFSGIGSFIDDTNKWSMVFRLGPQSQGQQLTFVTYICVGTVSDVRDCMLSVHSHTGATASVQV